MAVSEGELYIIDQQVPRLVYDNRAVGTRQRWLLKWSGNTDKPLIRHLIDTDAKEQFLRNDVLKDQPPYPAPLPGQPGTTEEAKGVNWTVLQSLSVLGT